MPDLQQAWAFLRNSDQIASAEQVDAAVRRVAGEIEAKLGGSYPLVLGSDGRGGGVRRPASCRCCAFLSTSTTVHASRYGAATRGTGLEWRVSPPDSREGACGAGRGRHPRSRRDDGGDPRAAARARRARRSTPRCWSTRCSTRKKPIRPDFVGLSIPDRFVFGCGMDAKGFWRNLPEIRAMKEG
jgi:hypoxanthine phosphoribosyltransferase